MASNQDQTNVEIGRLTGQHRWIQLARKGQLFDVPVDLKSPDLKVLDVGTADGVLLRDLSEQVSPSATLVGSDVNTSFVDAGRKTAAAQGIPNVDLVVHDVNTEFPPELQGTFTITNVRSTLVGVAKADLAAAVKHLVSTLAPGGWLQVSEFDMYADHVDLTPAAEDVVTLFRALFKVMGLEKRLFDRLEELFREAGLEEVSVRRVELPLGRKLGEGPQVAESLEPFKLTTAGLKKMCEQQCDLSPSVSDNIVERFEKEMTQTGATFYMLVVVGRKPL